MKVLILSDLNWDPHLRTINDYELQNFTLAHLDLPRYDKIRKYLDIIEAESPDLVLLAGDVTGDGSCGHGYHYALIILLSILESKKLQSYYISGNHDEPAYYEAVQELTKYYQYTQNITDQEIIYNGWKIMGVGFDTTKAKRAVQKIVKDHPGPYDLVLAHSQLKRRIRLFDMSARYLVTGHYDRKLLAHRDTVFISLDNDSDQVSYAVIEESDLGKYASIRVWKDEETLFSFTENVNLLMQGTRNHILKINYTHNVDLEIIERYPTQNLVDEKMDLSYLKFLRGSNYAKVLGTMYKTKNNIKLAKTDLALDKVIGTPITPMYGISKSLVKDYLD